MINKVSIQHFVGRELTDQEEQTLEWLNTWEDTTSSTMAGLIQEANSYGQQQSTTLPGYKMTVQEIQQFGQALAERWVQVVADKDTTERRFREALYSTKSTRVEILMLEREHDKAAATIDSWNLVIESLPEDIYKVFHTHKLNIE